MKPTIIRVPFLVALLAVAAAALVLGSAPHRTGAQTGAPAAADQDFVGARRLTTNTPFGASQSLLTVMADGTVLFSDRPVSPEDAGFPVTFISTGHGAWHQTGPTTAATTWVGLVTDGEGHFLAAVTDSVQATPGAVAGGTGTTGRADWASTRQPPSQPSSQPVAGTPREDDEEAS